jgi:hypothetical protein
MFLDPIQLESLTWAAPAHFQLLLKTPFGPEVEADWEERQAARVAADERDSLARGRNGLVAPGAQSSTSARRRTNQQP